VSPQASAEQLILQLLDQLDQLGQTARLLKNSLSADGLCQLQYLIGRFSALREIPLGEPGRNGQGGGT